MGRGRLGRPLLQMQACSLRKPLGQPRALGWGVESTAYDNAGACFGWDLAAFINGGPCHGEEVKRLFQGEVRKAPFADSRTEQVRGKACSVTHDAGHCVAVDLLA